MRHHLLVKPVRRLAGTSALVLCFAIAGFPGRIPAQAPYDAGDLVRAAQMVDGMIPPDPEFADLTGDGQVTEADLARMLRLVHGQELPERLFEETIGPGGGSLGDDQNMTVTVPAGAFDRAITLVIDRLPHDEAPLNGDDQGPLYQVSGFPYQAATSVTVRLPLPDGFDPAKARIEIGEPGFSTHGYGWQYHTVNPEYVDGLLIWDMPPIPAPEGEPGPAGLVPDSTRQTASYPAGYTYRRFRISLWESITGDRFDLLFSTDERVFYKSELWDLVDALEQIHTLLTEAPASFDLSSVSWPVRVYMKRLDGMYGQMVSSRWGDYIELNNSLLKTPELARVTAAHEFFHIVQAAYGSPRANLWLDEATATWFEKYMASDPATYEPGTFRNRPRTALRGMHVVPYVAMHLALWPGNWFTWETADAQNRGYALAGFLEFMDRKHNLQLKDMRELYENIRNGMHPVLALWGLSDTFVNDWRQYTKAAFDDPVWSSAASATMIEDPETAFGQPAEGAFGRMERITTLSEFARLREHEMHVQRLGGRSLTLAFDYPPLHPELPDRIRMVGEVQAKNASDADFLRLMAVLKGGPGNAFDPIVTSLDRDELLTARPDTRRIEVAFNRPAGRFRYMLGVFNDRAGTPYDGLAPVTLRSYIGAYQLGGYTTSFHPEASDPVAACRVEKVLIEGDLGHVDILVWENPVIRGSRIMNIRLPHEHVDSLHVTIDAALEPPLTRTYYDPRAMLYNNYWVGGEVTATVTDNQGWRVYAPLSGENVGDDLINPQTARTEGVELPAPAPDKTVIYNLLYFYTLDTVTNFDIDMPDMTWSTDSWYIFPLQLRIHGTQTLEEGP